MNVNLASMTAMSMPHAGTLGVDMSAGVKQDGMVAPINMLTEGNVLMTMNVSPGIDVDMDPHVSTLPVVINAYVKRDIQWTDVDDVMILMSVEPSSMTVIRMPDVLIREVHTDVNVRTSSLVQEKLETAMVLPNVHAMEIPIVTVLTVV